MLVLLADSFGEAVDARLKERFTITRDLNQLEQAEVIVVRSRTRVDKELIDRAIRLRHVIRGGVGLDNVDLKHTKKKGIRVDNTADASAVAVAELTMALMLGAICQVARAHKAMSEGKWLKKELKRTELFGKSLGVIGLGRIGNAVAARAAAFEMQISAHDPFVDRNCGINMLPDLDSLLSISDIVSIHAPLNEASRNMINEERICKMKKGVIVVNTARAGIVDQESMAAALHRKHVALYATDVWLTDPPSEDSPILSAPNTLLTPHIGSSSKENLDRIGERIAELLAQDLQEAMA